MADAEPPYRLYLIRFVVTYRGYRSEITIDSSRINISFIIIIIITMIIIIFLVTYY